MWRPCGLCSSSFCSRSLEQDGGAKKAVCEEEAGDAEVVEAGTVEDELSWVAEGVLLVGVTGGGALGGIRLGRWCWTTGVCKTVNIVAGGPGDEGMLCHVQVNACG